MIFRTFFFVIAATSCLGLIEFFGDRVDAEGRYQIGHRLEFYNLRTDIGETENLAADQPALKAELHLLFRTSAFHFRLFFVGPQTRRRVR